MHQDDRVALLVENAALSAERNALRQALRFFASVIKSGEPWTEACEKIYRVAFDGPSPPPLS